MLGYMSREALDATHSDGLVTFFSRSKRRLWRKGESSGNVLRLVSVAADCDWRRAADAGAARRDRPAISAPTVASATRRPGRAGLAAGADLANARGGRSGRRVIPRGCLPDGPAKAAQKVGEEGVEVALAAVSRDSAGLAEEAADLLFHLLVACVRATFHLKDQ